MNDRPGFLAKVEEYKRIYAQEVDIPSHELARVSSATLSELSVVGRAGGDATDAHSAAVRPRNPTPTA